MTHKFTRDHALLLAATEVLPGEWRDLADLVESAGLNWIKEDSVAHGGDLAEHVRTSVDEGRAEYWMKVLDRLAGALPTVQLVTVAEERFPSNLRSVYNRPPFLFVNGRVTAADERAVAIVGSRNASPAALEVAGLLARELAAAEVTVVSGLADGVDAAAHHGALAVPHGRTIAVFGTGIDRVYPEHNSQLARRITRQGATVSQFRPGSPPTRSTFPMRNAVISGLSRASVIVTASERSGTRSEADHSLRQGRPVLLWAPVLERQPWARKFVGASPQAHFVESADDILQHAELSAPHITMP